ncbi:Hypothetical predicted protein [Paramuricea clavata]|uniref:Uncharacterized protein n=1 Tax=Paramuricea clavata TaxID=317549 RepID=A0A6S7FM88_PARCT|nr:Hypothetical predicted protein [Paramuricea clavata]
MAVHDALLASTCEELHVVRNVDDLHKFVFIREKKATKQKNNKHVPMATTSKDHLDFVVSLTNSEESDESTSVCSCDSDDEPIDVFEDNPELPIFYRGELAGVPVVKVAEILLSPRLVLSGKVAKDKPVAVSKNVGFVFDNRHFKNTKDILSDSLGVWECTGTKTFHCIFTEDQVKLTDAKNMGNVILCSKLSDAFIKTRQQKMLREISHFKRRDEVKLGNFTMGILPRAVVLSSRLRLVAVDLLLEEKGGIKSIRSSGDIACDRQQAANFRRDVKEKENKIASSCSDPLLTDGSLQA